MPKEQNSQNPANSEKSILSTFSSTTTCLSQAFIEGSSQNMPPPIFQVGVSKVRWKPMPTSDWGLVMGMRYIFAEHLASWQWQYYIILDPSSPSYEWTQADWGWQDDLEPVPSDSSPATQLVEEVTTRE
jgi:hypothetical protein